MDRRIDVVLALGVAALGVFILVEAQSIGRSPIPDPIGPRGVPTGLGIAFLLSGVALAARRLLQWGSTGTIVEPEGSEDDLGVPAGSSRRAMAIWGASVSYVVALPFVGFIVATPILVGVILRLLQFDRPALFGRVPALFTYPVLFTAVAFAIFSVILGVRLPLGFVRDLFLLASGAT